MNSEYTGNKRRFPRIGFRSAVSYQYKGESRLNYTLAKNLSLGGMCLGLNEFIPKDRELVLEFPLKNYSEPVRAKAKVAWIRRLPYAERYHAGLEFSDIDEGYRINLAKFINNSSPVPA